MQTYSEFPGIRFTQGLLNKFAVRIETAICKRFIFYTCLDLFVSTVAKSGFEVCDESDT